VTGFWKLLVSILVVSIVSSCGGGSDSPADPDNDLPSPRLTGIYTTTPNIELQPGQTYKLTVMATYDDGSEADVSDAYDVRMAPNLYESNYTNYQYGVISVTETGSNITALAAGSGYSEVYYTEVDPVTSETFAYQMAVKITVGYVVPVELRGLWQYVHSGAERWLNNVLEYSYTQVDANQLKLTGSDGNTYYLLRAGIPDVQVAGQLSVLPDNTGKSKSNKAISVGDISLILENINTTEETDVSLNSDGSFDVTLPSTDYELTATDNVTGENITAQIDVSGATTDVGEFTLTNSSLHNFKSSLRNSTFAENNEFLYFGTLTGQTDIVYNKVLRVTNVGSTDVSGISFNITMPDPDVKNLTVTTTLGGMAAGGYLDIPVSFSFARPSVNKTVRLNIAITDINNQIWNDHVSLSLSKEKAVNVSVVSLGSTGVNGYLITPGRKLIRLDWSSSTVRVPYIAGESYQIAFSTPGITTEETYCVNVGFSQECNLNSFDGFTQTGINEPDDNVAAATTLGLFDQAVSYLSVGDIDYLNFSFDAIHTPFDGYKQGSIDTPGFANSVTSVGSYIYVADGESGIQVLDVSNPSTPEIVANSSAYSTTQELVVAGNYAYAFDYTGGLLVYDVSTPLSPVGVSQKLLAGVVSGGTVNGNFAYVSAHNDGLKVVDISNPAIPVHVGSVDTPGSAADVAVVGNIAYVADWTTGMQIVDVSQPAAPVIVGSIATLGAARSVDVDNNILFVSAGGAGLNLYDISTPSAPVLLGAVDTLFSTEGVKVVGDFAYVADGDKGMVVIDISTPTRPVIVSTLGTPNYATGIEVKNDVAYVSDLTTGLHIFSLTGGL